MPITRTDIETVAKYESQLHKNYSGMLRESDRILAEILNWKAGEPMATPLTDEQIARVAHEANRMYCESLGDDSPPAWENAPDWQRESAIAGVKLIRGEASNDRKVSPSISHEAWTRHKLRAGWKYGEIKDPEAKTHPCLVPFEQLPETQQRKDAIFISVVLGLTAV